MICYFMHIQQIFMKAGIEAMRVDKREIDRLIHSIVCVEYKNFPAAWREVKKKIVEDEEVFISKTKEAWSKRI